MVIAELWGIKMDFNSIAINYDEISQSVLNIEDKNRKNLFSWNGQFSPQFVEAELNKYAYAKEDFFVLDTFAGSGTVLYESARKGIKAYGVELNASAYYISKVYELCNLDIAEREIIIEDINVILDSLKEKKDLVEYLVSFKYKNDNMKNIIYLLIILMDIYNKEVSFEYLNKKWEILKEKIISLPYSNSLIKVKNGDARKLELEDNSVDLVLTSPPYINVLNYHQKYRASVEKLGFNVLDIAKSEFGSNRKNRGNRFYTVIQYCIDIALSLKEVNRVCKSDARMIYVVGRESKVLGCTFCNSELVYNIGTQIFNFDLLLRQERVFKNRFGQMIYEDILHFQNSEIVSIPDEVIISKARDIAVDMLKKTNIVDDKNIKLLEQAISNASLIKPSELKNY